jgi:hypothetical protein
LVFTVQLLVAYFAAIKLCMLCRFIMSALNILQLINTFNPDNTGHNIF